MPNRQVSTERRARGVCVNCGCRPPDKPSGYCVVCRATTQRRAQAYKLAAFEKLGGPICECCGESTVAFLTIDHVNDDGFKEASGTSHYFAVVKGRRATTDLRVLCFNCNCGRKVNGGICPHQEKS